MPNDIWNVGKTSRRDLLKGLGALGAGSALAATGLIAQNARSKRGRIDVHHHMLPPFQQISPTGIGPRKCRSRPWRSLAPKPPSSL